jgi:lipopolysaccharide/colanic/teichoic acid biosynthesis glycosyltransferase
VSPAALVRRLSLRLAAPAAEPLPRRVWDAEGFRERVRLECARTDRSGCEFSLVVLRVGEDGVPRAARVAGERIRETDELGRMDDGALAVLLTDTPAEGARTVADALAALVRAEGTPLDPPAVYTYPGDWLAPIPESFASADGPYGDPPPARRYPAWKRGMDVAGAVTGLFLLLPLLLAIALAVRLSSPGPVLYRQARIGYRGRPFTMLKFRSMRAEAGDGAHAAYLAALVAGTAAPNADGEFKLRGDPRVTRVGAFLRRTSLDELPQLLNVLWGHMGLVGPRPEPCYARGGYSRWYHRRVLDTKPGITGPWQVAARSRVTYETMVRIDLRYARRPTLLADLGLLARTLRAVVSGQGAC